MLPAATVEQAALEASVASVAPRRIWPAGAAVHVNESVLVASTGAVEGRRDVPEVHRAAENEEQVSGTDAYTPIVVDGLLVDAACAIELPASAGAPTSGAIFVRFDHVKSNLSRCVKDSGLEAIAGLV